MLLSVILFGCVLLSVICVFRQKTAYEMRIGDWSSDVCSSDLGVGIGGRPLEADDSAPDARRQFDPARLDRVDILPLAQGRGQGDVGDRMLDAVVEQRQRQGYIVRRGQVDARLITLQP